MSNKLGPFITKYREPIAYLFAGGTAVVVNIIAYWLFFFILSDIPANTIAFFITVMYTYFTNSIFVFRQPVSRESFIKFWAMRIGMLLIDNGGMWLLLTAETNRWLAKIAVNIIIIFLNYIFSKFFIFAKRRNLG